MHLPLVVENPVDKHGEASQETTLGPLAVHTPAGSLGDKGGGGAASYIDESLGQNKVRDLAVVQPLPNHVAPQFFAVSM